MNLNRRQITGKTLVIPCLLSFTFLWLRPLYAEPVAMPLLRTTLPASWDENWLASPAVFDLDQDGENDIIASRHSVTYVWDSAGVLKWRAPVGEDATSLNDHGSSRQYASPVVGDLDGDGDGEIVIAYSNKAAVYDHNGMLLDGWPQAFPNSSDEIRSIAVADLDQNGSFEILVVKVSRGPVTMAWDLSGSPVTGWPQVQNCAECSEYGGYNQNIGAADLNGDGIPEVISTYDLSNIGIMYADGSPFPAHDMFEDAGPWVSSVPMFHDLTLAMQGWGANGNDRDQFTGSPPVFGDIDGDGLLEVVIYSDHEVAGTEVIIGNCLWGLNPDMTRAPGFGAPICSGEPLFVEYQNNIVQVAPSPALANLSGDDRPEIVVPSYDGIMRCYSPDGVLLWSYTFDTVGGDFIGASGAVIADLNHDNMAEVIFTTYSTAQDVSHLIILNSSGDQLYKILLAKRGSMSPPTIADVDNNGIVEIVVSLKDTLGSGLGGVQIWDVASASSGLMPWPTGRGNLLRDGRLSPEGSPPVNITPLLFLLLSGE